MDAKELFIWPEGKPLPEHINPNVELCQWFNFRVKHALSWLSSDYPSCKFHLVRNYRQHDERRLLDPREILMVGDMILVNDVPIA